jgi:hypothetical protein
MSFWNFVAGAADKLVKDREAQGAEQREMEMWKKRAEFQAKIQADMEAAKERNRILAQGLDTKRGKLVTARADGTTEEIDAPQFALDQAKAAEQAALDKAAREQEKMELERMAKTASTEAARARASASLAAIARGEREQSRRDKETGAKLDGGYFTRDNESKAKKEADREVAGIAADIAKLEDEEATQRAIYIKNSNASPEEKRAQLQELLRLALKNQ